VEDVNALLVNREVPKNIRYCIGTRTSVIFFMQALPHHEHLRGFTLPLVISTLKQVGPPLAIAKVPDERKRGPLLVTLATELASIIVGLLYDSLTRGMGREEVENFLMIRGGKEFQDSLQHYQRVLRTKADLRSAIEQLESRALRLGAAEIVDKKPVRGSFAKCVEGGYIQWHEEISYVAETIHAWRAEYKQLSTKFQKISDEVNVIEVYLAKQRNAIFSFKDFHDGLQCYLKSRGLQGELPKKGIFVNFDSQHPLMQDGAAAIWQRTDARGWRAFEKCINESVRNTAHRGPVRLMLREALLVKAAHLLIDTKQPNNISRSLPSVDEAWIHVLRKPSIMPDLIKRKSETPDYPNSENCNVPNDLEAKLFIFPGSIDWSPYAMGLTNDNMRNWRRVLRREDADAIKWIKENSGVFHPCNWYELIDNMPLNEVRRLSNLNKQYPLERAINELYWCLCKDSDQTFSPLASVSYSIVKWYDWVSIAEAGDPPYWQQNFKKFHVSYMASNISHQ